MLRTRFQRCAVLCLLAAAWVLPTLPGSSQAQSVPLRGNTPPALGRGTLLGHRDPNDVVTIVVALHLRNERELDDLIDRQNRPESPDFHNFITPADFNRRFAPAQFDVEGLTEYLRSQGLTVLQVTPDNMLVQARGTVSQIEQAFDVKVNLYRFGTKQEFANDRDPSIPPSLERAVASVSGLTSLEVFHRRSQANIQEGNQQFIYTPQQIATAYNFPNVNNKYHHGPTYSGAGETIAIATAFPFDQSDVDYFWQFFGINRTGSVTSIPVNGPTNESFVETTIDVEQAGSQAPGADLLVYNASSNFQSDFMLVFSRIVTDNLAQEVSFSWGACEGDYATANINSLDTILKEGAAQGMSFFVASGDTGAYGCSATSTTLAVLYPSSDPYVTSVGATSLYLQPDGRRAYETAGFSGGGGISSIFARPTWQFGPGVPMNDYRDTADVSFDGEPNTGYYIYYQGQAYTDGGTSMGAPNWAALWALRGEAVGGKRTGLANPLLYGIGSSPLYPLAFYDITVGNNGNNNGPGYAATRFWDFPTGWGTPNGTALVRILRNFEDSGRFDSNPPNDQ